MTPISSFGIDALRIRPAVWSGLIAAALLAAPVLAAHASAQSTYEQQRGEQVRRDSMRQLQRATRGVDQQIQQSNQAISGTAQQQMNQRLTDQRIQQQILAQPQLVLPAPAPIVPIR